MRNKKYSPRAQEILDKYRSAEPVLVAPGSKESALYNEANRPSLGQRIKNRYQYNKHRASRWLANAKDIANRGTDRAIEEVSDALESGAGMMSHQAANLGEHFVQPLGDQAMAVGQLASRAIPGKTGSRLANYIKDQRAIFKEDAAAFGDFYRNTDAARAYTKHVNTLTKGDDEYIPNKRFIPSSFNSDNIRRAVKINDILGKAAPTAAGHVAAWQLANQGLKAVGGKAISGLERSVNHLGRYKETPAVFKKLLDAVPRSAINTGRFGFGEGASGLRKWGANIANYSPHIALGTQHVLSAAQLPHNAINQNKPFTIAKTAIGPLSYTSPFINKSKLLGRTFPVMADGTMRAAADLIGIPAAKAVIDSDTARGVAGKAIDYGLDLTKPANYRKVFRSTTGPMAGLAALGATNYLLNTSNPLTPNIPRSKKLSPIIAMRQTVQSPEVRRAFHEKLVAHPDTVNNLKQAIRKQVYDRIPAANVDNPVLARWIDDQTKALLEYSAANAYGYVKDRRLPSSPPPVIMPPEVVAEAERLFPGAPKLLRKLMIEIWRENVEEYGQPKVYPQ